MFKGIDLYSDTVTRPTPEMKQAMMEAELGDEQKGEDPTTQALEEKVASLLGKGRALFFPSATMANEVAIRLLCQPGDEVIAAEDSHIIFAEGGGPAVHAGVMVRPLVTKTGIFCGAQIRHAYRWTKGPHYPRTLLVSVENTTNMGGGVVWPKSNLDEVVETSRELKLRLHLDGSRLFHACVASMLSPLELCRGFDTVTLCLSKGLGCPAGAILAFSDEQWTEVRRLKQLMGGSLRQSGILAAAGIYALDHHVSRLQEDHENARWFSEHLTEVHCIERESYPPSTNMVFFCWRGKKLSPTGFSEACVREGLRFSHVGENRFRAVTHLDIKKEDLSHALVILKRIAERE